MASYARIVDPKQVGTLPVKFGEAGEEVAVQYQRYTLQNTADEADVKEHIVMFSKDGKYKDIEVTERITASLAETGDTLIEDPTSWGVNPHKELAPLEAVQKMLEPPKVQEPKVPLHKRLITHIKSLGTPLNAMRERVGKYLTLRNTAISTLSVAMGVISYLVAYNQFMANLIVNTAVPVSEPEAIPEPPIDRGWF